MSSLLETSGELRPLRLVGSRDVVSWVAGPLQAAGRLVERLDSGDHAGEVIGRGPVLWVTRPPTEPGGGPGWPPIATDGAVWPFPCLVVVRAGETVPQGLLTDTAAESYEIVREPEDAPVLLQRVDRLLLVHRRRSQIETVLQNLSDMVYTRKFDGTLTSMNAAGERFFGLKRTDLLGKRIQEIAEEREQSAQALRRTNEAVQANGRTAYRLNLKRPSTAREGVFDVEALLLRDTHGAPSGVQVIVSDITEDMLNKERIQREAERNEILAAIATAARDSLHQDQVLAAANAVLGTRLKARTVHVWFTDEAKASCTAVAQWREDESVPSHVGARRSLAESPALSALVRAQEPFSVADPSTVASDPVVTQMLRETGARSAVGVPICREGEMIGALCVTWAEAHHVDADELVFLARAADQLAIGVRSARLHQNLQQKLRALAIEQQRREEADRDRHRLIAMLVHDLKNPLSAVTAALELTRDRVRSVGDARLARMLDGSLASARGLQGLIEDVLLVYRPEDAPEPEKSLVNPWDVLALPLEEARWLARARRIQLEVDVPNNLPPVPLDVPRFRRAVANLLNNAIKFTPQECTVRVRAGRVAAGGSPSFFVEVRDSGPGVPPSLRDQLSTPYLRLPGSEAVPGTGLGLTVVQRVARAHGGRIEVGSGDRSGSVFTLLVPA